MASGPDRYALVGHPVAHSRSPLIHELFARQTGESITYELIDAPPAEFETAVLGFRAAGGKGLNVTVPHKEAAFELAGPVGDEASLARAVNTLSFTGNEIRGDNTDGIGFMRDVTVNQQWTIAGKRLLVLGAGGAAKGILGPLLADEPAALVLANRTLERAEALARQFEPRGEIEVRSFDDLADAGAFDIVVNATSAGLKGEQPPFPAAIVGIRTCCYDLSYGLRDSPFVLWARGHGAAHAVQGWGMLVEQAAESFRIWRGHAPDTSSILTQLTR